MKQLPNLGSKIKCDKLIIVPFNDGQRMEDSNFSQKAWPTEKIFINKRYRVRKKQISIKYISHIYAVGGIEDMSHFCASKF